MKTGYRLRTGIHELLINSEEIKRLIIKNASLQEIKASSIQGAIRTLVQDGIRKVFMGITDFKEIRRVTIT
jgi:general secretion pathway protein E